MTTGNRSQPGAHLCRRGERCRAAPPAVCVYHADPNAGGGGWESAARGTTGSGARTATTTDGSSSPKVPEG